MKMQFLHSESVIKGRRGSYDYWKGKEIAEILESFSQNPIFLKKTGLVMNGNTRLFVLQEKGFFIDSLCDKAIILEEDEL